MCRDGIPVSWSLAHVLGTRNFTDPEMICVFIDPTIYSVPPPGSGAVLASIINIMENFDIIEDDPIFYHRLDKSFKWAYGAISNLGDPNDDDITEFVNEVVANLTIFDWAYEKYNMINDSYTVNDPLFDGANF